MSGTYPTTPSFNAVDFQINSPGKISESFSGKLRRVSAGTQYYSFGVQYPNVIARDFGPVAAFIARQYGSFDDFQIVLPEISFPKGNNYSFIGTPQVASAQALTAGTTSIPCNAFGGASKTEVLRAGDFIKFANHTKVYMVVEDVNTNSSSEATITINPGLVVSVPVGTLLTTTAVPFTVVMEDFDQEYSVGIGGITTMTLKMREVF
jgi:hypothetical protein